MINDDFFRKGAISVRVSTEMQTKYSPDSQIKMCLEYAKSHNIYVNDENIYRDDGISGKCAEKRTEFQRMISDAQKQPKPFDCILVYDFSRFARNKEESVMYKAMLRKKYNIEVISITQPLADGKERVILESMYEAMDEYYILNLSENVKRGKLEKASRGEYQGRTPFGYFYDKNQQNLVINPETSKIVKYIFDEWLKDDTTLNGLTKNINNMGIKTVQGNRWCEGSLKYLLNNPLYAGYVRYTDGGMKKYFNNVNTKVIKGNHEPIITEGTWEKVKEKNQMHEKNWFKYKKPSVKHEYWLRGLIKCSSCGKNLIMIQRKSGKKTKPFFQCNGYNKKMCPDSHSILQEKLENALLTEIEKIFTKKINITISDNQNNTTKTNLFESAIKKQKDRLDRIEIAYMDGIDTLAEYKEKKVFINQEISRLTNELERINSLKFQNDKSEKVYNLCEYAHRILASPDIDFKIKDKIAHELFKEIIYNKKENSLIITFNELS